MLLSSTVFYCNIMDYCQFFAFCFSLQWIRGSSDYPRIPVACFYDSSLYSLKRSLMTPTQRLKKTKAVEKKNTKSVNFC